MDMKSVTPKQEDAASESNSAEKDPRINCEYVNISSPCDVTEKKMP